MNHRPSHRTRLLDLDGRNPRPFVPPVLPAQPKEKTVTVTTRPPRPVHLEDELLDRACQATAMKPREIIDVRETDAGLIVYTHDGWATIVVPADRPDALGQTGCLLYPTPGRDAPRGVRVFADPAAPVTVADRGEPWTVADFDVAASKIVIPPKIGGRGGPSWLPFVEGDPTKAYAVWKHIAGGHEGSLRGAAHYNAEAAECRRIVVESGWLDAREAAAL